MELKYSNAVLIKEANWNERTCERRQGGFTIDKTSLPTNMKVLPKGAVIALNSSGNAILVKTAQAQADAASAATSLKVKKGHNLVVGDVIAGSTISAINTSNSSYDTLTVTALGSAITANDVLNTSLGEGIVGLNYAPVVIDDQPTCTVTLQAYDIDEDTMPYAFGLNATIKEGLTSRHSFLNK